MKQKPTIMERIRIKVSEIEAVQKRIDEINSLNLNDIDFVLDNEEIINIHPNVIND